MKKKVYSILALIIVSTLALCGCGKSAYKSFSELTDSETEAQLTFAEAAASSYYELLMSDNEKFSAIINNIEKQTNDEALLNSEISEAIGKIKEMIPDAFSDNLKEYMAAKLFCESCFLVLNNSYEEITKSDFKAAEWEIINEQLVCKVNCTVTYKTVQHGSDSLPTSSAIGEQLQLVIDNAANPSIVDCYCAAPSSFDAKIRTYELDMYNADNWLDNTDKEELSQKLTEECALTFISYLNSSNPAK